MFFFTLVVMINTSFSTTFEIQPKNNQDVKASDKG